jgi:succinoglycan biosynthesis transport protein ExoP
MFTQYFPEPSDSTSHDRFPEIVRLEKKVDDLLSLVEPVPYQAPGSDSTPAGVNTYWGALKRRKFLVMSAGIVIAAGAWYFTNRLPKIYQASTTLEILEPDRGSMNMQNFTKANQNLFNQETYLQTQVSLIESKALLERVGKRLLSEGVISEADLPTYKAPSTAESQQQNDPALSLTSITVVPVRGTRLVAIAYNARNPELAAKIANSLASEYIQQDVDSRVNTAEQTRMWLENQLQETKNKLEASEAKLQNYARSSGLLYTSPKGTPAEETEEKLQFLAHDLSETEAKRASLEARYKTLAAGADAKEDEADSGPLVEIQSHLVDLRRQRAALASQYTPEYSKVKELDAQIATLQDAEEKERKRWVDKLYSAYQTEVAHQKLIEDAYKHQTEVVTDQASKAINYNVLKREVETNRNLYDALLSGMKEAGVNASARVRNARIVDSAEPPRLPFSPHPTRSGIIGLIAGLMLGAAFVLATENNDRRVKRPGTAQSYLNIPELGVIPSTKPHLLPTARQVAMGRGNGNGVSMRTMKISGFMRNQATRSDTPVFEAFHSVVTSILSPGRSTNVPRVLVVTSGALHEGKSTVCSNLALMAAQIGQRVILIDGDMRNPRLHQIYQLSNDRGLCDILAEPDELDSDALSSVIQKTGVPNLSLLASGEAHDAVAPMLHSPRLEELVNQLRVNYDLVLIDTPPVLPFADARIFGKLADAVVLVVRAGQTTRDTAMAAKARFVEDGLPVFGTVLNDWNGKEATYEYGSNKAYRH